MKIYKCLRCGKIVTENFIFTDEHLQFDGHIYEVSYGRDSEIPYFHYCDAEKGQLGMVQLVGQNLVWNN